MVIVTVRTSRRLGRDTRAPRVAAVGELRRRLEARNLVGSSPEAQEGLMRAPRPGPALSSCRARRDCSSKSSGDFVRSPNGESPRPPDGDLVLLA